MLLVTKSEYVNVCAKALGLTTVELEFELARPVIGLQESEQPFIGLEPIVIPLGLVTHVILTSAPGLAVGGVLVTIAYT